jgi:hypothetical protein
MSGSICRQAKAEMLSYLAYYDELTGAEALIRWNNPRTGLVLPGQFIPMLAETGLIYDVGRSTSPCAGAVRGSPLCASR